MPTPNPVDQQTASLAVANQGIATAAENQRAKLQAAMQAASIRQRGAEANLRAQTHAEGIKNQAEMAALDRESRTDQQDRADTRQQKEMDFASGEARKQRQAEGILTIGMGQIEREIAEHERNAMLEFRRGNFERSRELKRKVAEFEQEWGRKGNQLARLNVVAEGLRGLYKDSSGLVHQALSDHVGAQKSRLNALDQAIDDAAEKGISAYGRGSVRNPITGQLPDKKDAEGRLARNRLYLYFRSPGLEALGEEAGIRGGTQRINVVRRELIEHWIGGLEDALVGMVPSNREHEFVIHMAGYLDAVSREPDDTGVQEEPRNIAAKHLYAMRKLAEDEVIGTIVKGVAERADAYLLPSSSEAAARDFNTPLLNLQSQVGIKDPNRARTYQQQFQALLGPLSLAKVASGALAGATFFDENRKPVTFGDASTGEPNLRPLDFKNTYGNIKDESGRMYAEGLAVLKQFLPEEQWADAIGFMPDELKQTIREILRTQRAGAEELVESEGFDIERMLGGTTPQSDIATRKNILREQRTELRRQGALDEADVYGVAAEQVGGLIADEPFDFGARTDRLLEDFAAVEDTRFVDDEFEEFE